MINAKDSQNTFYILDKKNDVPIVFIHGVGLNHKIWEPQINVFKNTFLAYDILGHGKTPLNKENLSFDDFSNGSLIARNFASKYSDRLESLILLCSIFRRTEKQQQIVKDRFELAKKSKSLSKQALKRWFTDEYLEKNPNTYNKISSILEQNSMENFLKIYELFVNHKDDEQFEKIKTKTLIMTGEGDIGSTPEMSINLSKVINNSNVKIISKGKHLCSIECADDVNMAIKKHIQND